VRGREGTAETGRCRKAAVVDAFLAAARGGDFEALLAILDPDVVLRADGHALALGAAAETHGAEPVAAGSRRAAGPHRGRARRRLAARRQPAGPLY
jgi:ketosteroid isomerase-like protein